MNTSTATTTSRGYLAGVDSENFDLREYILAIDPVNVDRILADPECRRALTRHDPLLFALIYMNKSLKNPRTGSITFADLHFDLCRQAIRWAKPVTAMGEERDAYLAPRAAGKSTWLLKILTIWAAAHGHVRFVAMFKDNGQQAGLWLGNVKKEIDSNDLLRMDYPEFCAPATRSSTGRAANDNRVMYQSRSGATFAAFGIDSGTLGLNVDDARPDMIIFDDIEPDEATYSLYQKSQRLTSVVDAVFPMNYYARVLFIGTVQMDGAIFHDFVRYNDGEKDDETRWVEEQKIRIHHYEPIVPAADGSRRSFWPGMWPTDQVLGIEHTVAFAKSWANRPNGKDGEYWTPDLFVYEPLPSLPLKILSIDPAVKDKKENDYTAMAVIGYDPSADVGNPAGGTGAFEVIDAVEMKIIPGQAMVNRVLGFLATYPDIYAVVIEDNQGGALWNDLFADLPCKLWTVTQTEPKWTRAQKVLNLYQLEKVRHRRKIPKLERQMCAFPRVINDDQVDAVTTGILEILSRYAMPAPAIERSYM